MTEAFPLAWPTWWDRSAKPKRSRFGISFARARDGLFAEIRLMGGRYPVLSSNIPLRRDGLPYASQPEPSDKGVACYFEYNGKQMVFACDRWDRVKDNVRAIQKSINAIRGIESWGASDMMERAFSAFEALPPPGGWKADLLFKPEDQPTEDEIKSRFRNLVKDHHPDHGGDAEQFLRLNKAYEQGLTEARV